MFTNTNNFGKWFLDEFWGTISGLVRNVMFECLIFTTLNRIQQVYQSFSLLKFAFISTILQHGVGLIDTLYHT